MIPVRNVQEFNDQDGKITLHIPKFKNAWMRKYFIPERRSRHFRIHLDVLGSHVWRLIDGQRDTQEICEQLSQIGDLDQGSPVELRVTKFLSQLYKNRFIVFR